MLKRRFQSTTDDIMNGSNHKKLISSSIENIRVIVPKNETGQFTFNLTQPTKQSYRVKGLESSEKTIGDR